MSAPNADQPGLGKMLFAALCAAAVMAWVVEALLPEPRGIKPFIYVLIGAGAVYFVLGRTVAVSRSRRVCPECGQESLQRWFALSFP